MLKVFGGTIKMGGQKSLGKNSIIQNSMLDLEFGIQIQQGWQFLHYCQNVIEKILFFHLNIPFFPHVLHLYSQSKMFSEKYLAFLLIYKSNKSKNAII